VVENVRRARTARALQNDRRILDAAVSLIDERGADSVGLRDVARVSELTYGALYGRYDNVAELLVDLWSCRLGAEIERLITLAASAARSGSLDGDDLRWVTEPGPELRAAMHLCMVTSRIDELGDVVPVQLQAWFEAAGAFDEPGGDPILLGLASLLFGAVVVAPVHSDGSEPVSDAVRWVRTGSGGASPAGPPPEPARPAPYVFGVEDEALGALLHAAVDVVSRSGLQGATLKRIGRVAGYSPSTAYHFYETRDDLLLDMVTRCVWHSRGPSSLSVGASVLEAAAIKAGATHPETARLRRLTHEFLLAAHHDERLASVVDEADSAALAQSAVAISPDPAFRQGAMVVLQASRDVAVGLSLISDLIDLQNIDWRAFATAFVDGLVSAHAAEVAASESLPAT